MSSHFSPSDMSYMDQALALARQGGRTSPNPQVGAVLVRDGKILACGTHRGPGTPHAEIDALQNSSDSPQGATLYVTLEPCCHLEKRTPPCVGAILKNGISRVVVGSLDPNPQVAGEGIRQLRSEGIAGEVGCREEECRNLIRAYAKWIVHQRPYVSLKLAMSLDGKIALKDGRSKWITGDVARAKTHELRAASDLILIGSQTAALDNPELTVRLKKQSAGSKENPVRLVLDSHLRLSLDLKVFSTAKTTPTWLATLKSQTQNKKITALTKKGVEIFFCPPDEQGRVDLVFLLEQLGQRGMTRVLAEGGAGLASSLVEQKLVDELMLFIAPKILGGNALDVFSGISLLDLSQAPLWEFVESEILGQDLLVKFYPSKTSAFEG